MKNDRGKYQRKQNLFSKIDDFWKILIRLTIYGFYQTKIAPMLDMLLSKLKEILAVTDYKFPYVSFCVRIQ